MMLNNIGFDGFLIKSSNYKVNDVTDKGTFNVFFSDSVIRVFKNEETQEQQISLTFDVDMVGYSENTDPESDEAEPAFEVNFVIETLFVDLNEKHMEEKDIEENMWFFENFNQISTKIAAENSFKNSEISHIPIPWTAKSATFFE